MHVIHSITFARRRKIADHFIFIVVYWKLCHWSKYWESSLNYSHHATRPCASFLDSKPSTKREWQQAREWLVKYIVYCVFTPLNLLRVLSPWGLPCTQKKVDGFWCEKAHSPIHEILVLFLWHNWSLDIPLSLETLIDLMGSPVQVVFRLKLLLKRSVFD